MTSMVNCANVDRDEDKSFLAQNNPIPDTGNLKSGRYGDVSLAVSGDTVTGVYEYYDKWDKDAKQFKDVSVFYFFGRLVNGQCSINASWPGDEILSGLISYSSILTLTLNDQPNGYAAVDFIDAGYKSSSTGKKDWRWISVVKSDKSYLYKEPNSEKTKVYIVAEDVVKILEVVPGWCRIEYSSPGNPGKVFIGWLRSDDLYSLDPNNW